MAAATTRERTPSRVETRGEQLADRAPGREPAGGRLSHGSCAASTTRTLWVTGLLGCAIVGPRGQHLGHVRDVLAQRLPGPAGTVVTGMIADLGGHRVFVSAAAVRDSRPSGVTIDVSSVHPAFLRRPGQVLLGEGVIGQFVLTAAEARAVRIRDIALRRTTDGWAVRGADLRSAVQAALGCPRRVVEWDVLVERRVQNRGRTRWWPRRAGAFGRQIDS